MIQIIIIYLRELCPLRLCGELFIWASLHYAPLALLKNGGI